MEQNTLRLDKAPTFTYKIGRQKRSVAAVVAIVLLAYVFSVCLALFTNYIVFTVGQSVLFLTLGFLHLYTLGKDLSMLTVAEKWIFTFTMAATILVLYGFSFLWGVHLPLVLILAGPGAFLLPFLLSEMLRLYLQISYADAIIWHPTNELSASNPDIYLNPFPVRFKIVQGESGKENYSIDFRASRRMNVGEVFCDMVQKQKKQGLNDIALASSKQVPLRWFFATRDMLWKRTLDPGLSLPQNKVKEDAVIYAIRVDEQNSNLPEGEQE